VGANRSGENRRRKHKRSLKNLLTRIEAQERAPKKAVKKKAVKKKAKAS
jgi:hypothetical protein